MSYIVNLCIESWILMLCGQSAENSLGWWEDSQIDVSLMQDKLETLKKLCLTEEDQLVDILGNRYLCQMITCNGNVSENINGKSNY